MSQDHLPPPGAVFELAERAVDFVRRAVGVPLDYTLETLPALDHYLGTVPRDRPDLIRLVAAAAGAYFGEVARRTIGGTWDAAPADDAGSWRLELANGLSLSPVALAAEAIVQAELEGFDGTFDVPLGDRAAVEQALATRGDVPEDEYYSLSGRLETLQLVADVLAARRLTSSNRS